MKKQNIERLLSDALKKEAEAFPSPSPNLRNRLLFTPQRVRKIVWTTAIGFATTAVILFFICVDFQQQPEYVDDYFKPTKVVDLNEMNFEPTKIIQLEE
jgi:hypothetical protein